VTAVATDLGPESGETPDTSALDASSAEYAEAPLPDPREENRRLRAELADTLAALSDLRERFDALTRADPAEDPRPALREIAALSRRLRELEAEQVQTALARGFSYAEIAAELGVTRQSVHQKHPRRPPGEQRGRN
jgi:DNA-directed RNA polymerase specialized sigma24 family protein